MAISSFDHNEADIFGNAVLTTPDPLQGYDLPPYNRSSI
jgi:hypothetical protein